MAENRGTNSTSERPAFRAAQTNQRYIESQATKCVMFEYTFKMTNTVNTTPHTHTHTQFNYAHIAPSYNVPIMFVS